MSTSNLNQSSSSTDAPWNTPWPEDELEAVAVCPVCGDDRRRTLYHGLTDKVFFCAPGKWSLHQCEGCGSAFMDPRPTETSIHLAYRSYYTHSVYARPASEKLNGVKRLQRVFADGYRNWRFGTNFSPASRFGVLVAFLLPARKETLDRELRHLPKDGRGKRVLDVGFGDGTFLEGARKAGWSVSGVDPDPVVVQSGLLRGMDVRRGGIEAYADQSGSFDVITLRHVIEHVYDPVDVLRQAYLLLRPGGRLWLETPNIKSNGHKAFGRNWLHLDAPRHLILFSWDSLSKIVTEAGFVSPIRYVFFRATTGSFAASYQVARGLNPLGTYVPTFTNRWNAWIARFKAQIFWKSSEHVTLAATKPNGTGK